MMRICASLGSADNILSGDMGKADIIEIRTDIFDRVPRGILKEGQKGILSFKDGIDASLIPDAGWTVDVGDASRPDIVNEKISSYHDFEGTPDADEISDILGMMDGDIVKGAFAVDSMKDLATLFDVAASMKKRHVIIGMGELGRVTRIRQRAMGNEFTFAFVGRETAPGQFSVAEMSEMGDDVTVTGIIGSGIGYTRSPAMHAAAFKGSSLSGRYLVFDTPSLDRVRDAIVDYEIKGVNVTKPYKTEIMGHLDSFDRISEETGAVNTVVNDGGRLRGYNTDVHGIGKALERNSVAVDGKKALVMGSGGAARACVHFLTRNGCDVTVTGRNRDAARTVASDFGAASVEPSSAVLERYDVLVNCTPVGRDDGQAYPVDVNLLKKGQAVFDMVYGTTRLGTLAKEKGCAFVPGEDMLAYQGARSFELFTSRTVPFETMRSAI